MRWAVHLRLGASEEDIFVMMPSRQWSQSDLDFAEVTSLVMSGRVLSTTRDPRLALTFDDEADAVVLALAIIRCEEGATLRPWIPTVVELP